MRLGFVTDDARGLFPSNVNSDGHAVSDLIVCHVCIYQLELLLEAPHFFVIS